jgi:hypothetical protein
MYSEQFTAHVKELNNNKKSVVGCLATVDRPGIDKLVEFLANSSFYTDPASAKYHSAFDGGLVKHSLITQDLFIQTLDSIGVHGDNNEYNDLINIVPLLHDVCKIGRYNVRMSWRKDAKDKWESYPSYEYVNDTEPFGHGAKSVLMLLDFIPLTMVEKQCIFWHMGPSTTTNIADFYSACISTPAVAAFHAADVMASTCIETQGLIEELVKKDKTMYK